MNPPAGAPFRASTYELEKGRIRLGPISGVDAEHLASAFATIDPWARYPYPPQRLAAYFAGGDASAPRFAILSDGALSGAVGLRLDWLRGPFLQFLGIIPGAQGQRLGASILAWIEAEARRGAERNLWVTASDFNARAIRFYEQHGYVKAARLDDLLAEGKAEILLRKRLL